jgi:DNA-binding MarR family transcriptional regulator
MQRWNELLTERFEAAGFGDVRPSYGSVLLPLFEEDGLRMGELARRARLSKQTITELVRRMERDRLVERRGDPADGRASLIFLTSRSREFEPVAAGVLAELDRLVRSVLDPDRVGELKASLRALADIGVPEASLRDARSGLGRRPRRSMVPSPAPHSASSGRKERPCGHE